MKVRGLVAGVAAAVVLASCSTTEVVVRDGEKITAGAQVDGSDPLPPTYYAGDRVYMWVDAAFKFSSGIDAYNINDVCTEFDFGLEKKQLEVVGRARIRTSKKGENTPYVPVFMMKYDNADKDHKKVCFLGRDADNTSLLSDVTPVSLHDGGPLIVEFDLRQKSESQTDLKGVFDALAKFSLVFAPSQGVASGDPIVGVARTMSNFAVSPALTAFDNYSKQLASFELRGSRNVDIPLSDFNRTSFAYQFPMSVHIKETGKPDRWRQLGVMTFTIHLARTLFTPMNNKGNFVLPLPGGTSPATFLDKAFVPPEVAAAAAPSGLPASNLKTTTIRKTLFGPNGDNPLHDKLIKTEPGSQEAIGETCQKIADAIKSEDPAAVTNAVTLLTETDRALVKWAAVASAKGLDVAVAKLEIPIGQGGSCFTKEELDILREAGRSFADSTVKYIDSQHACLQSDAASETKTCLTALMDLLSVRNPDKGEIQSYFTGSRNVLDWTPPGAYEGVPPKGLLPKEYAAAYMSHGILSDHACYEFAGAKGSGIATFIDPAGKPVTGVLWRAAVAGNQVVSLSLQQITSREMLEEAILSETNTNRDGTRAKRLSLAKNVPCDETDAYKNIAKLYPLPAPKT